MIEPFEHDKIVLKRPAPTGVEGSQVLVPQGIDKEVSRTMSVLTRSMDDIRLDTQQIKVHQTRIGNPSAIDNHSASYIYDRITSLGPIAPNYETPTVSPEDGLNSSQLLHQYLDSQATFKPRIDAHKLPAFSVTSLNSPYLTPGLTSIDSRKVDFNWVK
jgi:hypothetical protein